MPAYRVKLVAYRYAIVQATDVLTAHKWAHNRPGNELFGDPGFWTVERVDDAPGQEAYTLVHADGTHTYIEED